MSGIEVAGIVLGAFPLIISALEHYETTKKAAGTFYKIRRAHRKDVGRVKDSELRFKLNLKELLLPLLVDEVVSKPVYEELLAYPGGPQWRDNEVEEALVERLSDCHERYIETLGDMEETMAALCKAARVDDEQFQGLLKDQSASANTSTQKARFKLMLASQTCFQAKRLGYAVTGSQRGSLLQEVEDINQRLETTLAQNDRVAAISRQSTVQPAKTRIPKPLLQFWRHADCIYRLLTESWKCQCKGVHCMKLWLKQRTTSAVDLNIALQFCHGSQSVNIKLADSNVVSSQGPATPLRLPLRPINKQNDGPAITVHHSHTSSSTSISGANRTRTATKVSYATSTTSIASAQWIPMAMTDIKIDGLCDTVKQSKPSNSDNDCFGLLTDYDSDRSYMVSSAGAGSSPVPSNATTLSAALESKSLVALSRVQRYSIASTLASSLLQYEATPWSRSWSSEHVHFPNTAPVGQASALAHDQPYLITTLGQFQPSSDDSFKTLGTSLLELCFGKLLDDHYLWQQPGFAAAKSNEMLRQFVASEWLKDADGEAGEQFADAIRWCLRQAPAVIRGDSDKWRESFAQHVAFPLAQCHENMQPRRT